MAVAVSPRDSSLWVGFEPKAARRGVSVGGSGKRSRYGCGRVSVAASSAVTAAEKPQAAPEIVLQPISDVSGVVKLPGSKSLSNRILLLAALAEVIHSFGWLVAWLVG